MLTLWPEGAKAAPPPLRSPMRPGRCVSPLWEPRRAGRRGGSPQLSPPKKGRGGGGVTGYRAYPWCHAPPRTPPHAAPRPHTRSVTHQPEPPPRARATRGWRARREQPLKSARAAAVGSSLRFAARRRRRGTLNARARAGRDAPRSSRSVHTAMAGGEGGGGAQRRTRTAPQIEVISSNLAHTRSTRDDARSSLGHFGKVSSLYTTLGETGATPTGAISCGDKCLDLLGPNGWGGRRCTGCRRAHPDDDDTGGLSGRPPLRLGPSYGADDPAKSPRLMVTTAGAGAAPARHTISDSGPTH